jgi:hypothetical protein
MLQPALGYGRNGWDVFPCIRTGEQAKAPLTANGYKDSTRDIEQITRYWTQHPDALIGLAVPDHLIVFDIDPRNGGSLEALETVLGPLPATLTSYSGRGDGGCHLFFHNPGFPISSRQLPPGIDVKAGGKGYVIAPPSPHPVTGDPYQWDTTHTQIAHLPATALEALQQPTKPAVKRTGQPGPVTVAQLLATGGHGHQGSNGAAPGHGLVRTVTEAVVGERNTSLFWAACRALDDGNDHLLPELLEAATSVGLTESEASATINSARDTPRNQPEPYQPPTTGPVARLAQPAPTSRQVTSPESGVPSRDTSPEPVPDAGGLPGPGEPADPSELSTWAPIDLTPYLDGTYQPPEATLMARTDGPCLLYPSKVHSLSGESESGKSMIAIAEVAQQLKANQPVLFLDYESDAATVVDRLLKMGASKESILDHFDYRLPEVDPVTAASHDIHQWADLLSNTYSLAVLDGVTEALGISGASSMDNDEVTHWIRKVPRAIADHTGAATLLIDHVTKSRETRGRFAIGAQSKLSALSGAAYIVEPLQPLGVGLLGVLQIKVAKDRPGQVRPHSKGWDQKDRLAIIAEAVIDSTNPFTIDYQLEPPSDDLGPADDDLKHRILESIRTLQKVEPPTWNKIRADVRGNNTAKRDALDELIKDGLVRVEKKGQAQFHSIPEGPQ